MTQNSHRNSDNPFEEAPLTPIGSTLTQDVFKAAAILGLAIAAVTFFATRSEHPERLSRLSYKPPTIVTQVSAAEDVSVSAPEAKLAPPVDETVTPALLAISTPESMESEAIVAVVAETVEPATVPVEIATTEAQEEVQTSPAALAELDTPEGGVNAQVSEVERTAVALPSWNLQRVGMGQVRAYRPPVIAPAVELPPMPQREARMPRLPRSLVVD